jgi:uncharacterized membrane protein
MSTYDWLLFFHLLGAAMFLSGAVAYHVLQLFATRRERPSEIAALLGLTRLPELGIRVGSLLVLAIGIWLAYVDEEIPQYKITDGWILAAIGLWVVATALGERAARNYHEAHKLSQRLAAAGDAASSQLETLVRNPRAAATLWASTATIVAILVLMIWKPGAP